MQADDIIDRQRLRRKVTFWRIAAILIAAIGVIWAASYYTNDDETSGFAYDHIAKVKIDGTIFEDEELLERLEKIEDDDFVKGVILSIDSPGGTTVGGEAIFEAVRKIAEKKPVVAQVGTLAASAGYMIASATDQIVARKSSIVGSIGVIFQYPNFEGLLDNLGVDMRSIKSSPMKAEPNFYGDTPPEAEAMIERMIVDSYDWFKGIVTERRGFEPEKTAQLADGSVFTGRQALENGLIDQLGGEDVARDWLIEQGVDQDLDTKLWKKKPERNNFLLPNAAMAWFMKQVGLESLSLPIAEQFGKRLALDGMLSIWHVQSAEKN
ncbi:signal peptide peptidase SppA [Ahrensia kielensis]|uniref:Signal peptide peptidase SppA n=1 Tax=Ahrensia kielensis TaxID=76980 RepID=A0ABU9TAJ7_9HYPH